MNTIFNSKTVAKNYKYTHLKKYRELNMVIEQIIPNLNVLFSSNREQYSHISVIGKSKLRLNTIT